MHAIEWITTEGRFLRAITAGKLRLVLGRPKGVCTWCGGTAGKGRINWCGEMCVFQFRARCDPGYCRGLVWDRDRGVCAICGIDTGWLTDMVQRFRRALSCDLRVACRAPRGWALNRRGRRNRRRVERYRRNFALAVPSELRRCLERRGFQWRSAYWEADHILPVSCGGGLCGPHGLRTLCLPCHKRVTANLRKLDTRQETQHASTS